MNKFKMKLLLVDDDQQFVHHLSQKLQSQNIDSHFVLSGEAALEAIREDIPDIMIIDVHLPGIDGMELLRQIKKTNSAIRFILLTGHGHDEDEEEARQIGIFEYLRKPLDVDEVVDAVMQAIKSKADEHQLVETYKHREKDIKKSIEFIERNNKFVTTTKRHIRILLGGDQEEYSKKLFTRLSKHNFTVNMVGNFEAIIPKLAETAVDVILLNIGTSYQQAMHSLRQIHHYDASVQIILLADQADFSRCMQKMQLGVFDYLLKPVDTDELLEKIHDAVQEKIIHPKLVLSK